MKPLGHKAYGSIPHLPGSRLGEGDHHVTEGQARIATEKARDKHDLIIVQEKLDGSNCSVAKINNEIVALGRSGYLAKSSLYPVHHVFAAWVETQDERFSLLLKEGERVSGEFLGQAVGTRYNLKHEPFVPFDILTKMQRLPYNEFEPRVKALDFTVPNLLHMGSSFSVEDALNKITASGHGAIDEVEGAVWRVERKGTVDFLCKYVHHHKQDGKYMLLDLWNIDITPYSKYLKRSNV
jgi:hypothetical protein